jgi:hypothetical protein
MVYKCYSTRLRKQDRKQLIFASSITSRAPLCTDDFTYNGIWSGDFIAPNAKAINKIISIALVGYFLRFWCHMLDLQQATMVYTFLAPERLIPCSSLLTVFVQRPWVNQSAGHNHALYVFTDLLMKAIERYPTSWSSLSLSIMYSSKRPL